MGIGYVFKDTPVARDLMEKLARHKFRDGSMLLLTEEEFKVMGEDVIAIELPDVKEKK